MFGKPATAITTFDWCGLRSGMIYHLIYHHSLALHVNHLVFLNTYLFGIWLLLAAADPIAGWAAAAAYAVYATALAGPLGGLFGLLQVAAAYGATALHTALLTDGGGWAPWEVVMLGVGLVLGSFMAQLAGHASSEAFIAPPHLFHGFVAAPILEWVGLAFRLGALPALRRDVLAEVATARGSAAALLS